MTLLPIIYTSLMIFSAFLFFVIIVSYISFKLKGGRNQFRNSQQLAPVPIIAARPVRIVSSTPVLQKPVRPNYNLNHNMIEKNINTQIKSELRNDYNDYRAAEKRQSEHANYNVAKQNPLNRNTKSASRATRIEIVNTSEKNNRPLTVDFPIRSIRSSQSLSDANILNYYSDRNDKGFVSLKAV